MPMTVRSEAPMTLDQAISEVTRSTPDTTLRHTKSKVTSKRKAQDLNTTAIAYDPNARRYTPRMRGLREEQPQPDETDGIIQAFIALETTKHDPRLTPEAKAKASRKEVANILQYDTVIPEHPESTSKEGVNPKDERLEGGATATGRNGRNYTSLHRVGNYEA